MMDTSEEVNVHTRQWALQAESEYRFELDPGTTLAIKLVSGHAEIFGAELADGKAAVFTWLGCTIEMSHPSVEYVSDETPMSVYANVHLALEQMRVRALAAVHGSPVPDGDGDGTAGTDPPRVLVLGPENSGKTSVCKILANYAVSAGQDWMPTYVNVDPRSLECPWAISAAPITAPIKTSTPASAIGATATTAPNHVSSNALLPLSFWYGHAEMRRNPLLMDRLIRNLGENIRDRYESDADGRCSGLIVDTPSSFAASSGTGSDHRLNMIKACVDAFHINVILVVGHEKLNVEMQRTYGNRMAVLKIAKSGGVVEVDAAYRERIHKYQVHTYFYGYVIEPPPGLSSRAYVQAGEQTPDQTMHLSPLSTSVNFGDIVIYRIGEETMAPSSALPIGAARVVSEMQPLVVDPTLGGSGLYNAVLAILAPPNPDESERYDEEILDLPVIGYIAITALDVPNRRMTVLSPGPGSLTGKTAIVGSFEWQE
ncbi:hypothetical protein LXA43DRAFT_1044507 [Ganoderma leucocontextum]|nr:hypothetical protein LXA43DRAFT_1044507 [Ganoderma leucocontextum]